MAPSEIPDDTRDVAERLRENLQQYGRAFLREVAEAAVKYHVILRSPTVGELQVGTCRPGNMVIAHDQTNEEVERWLCRTFLTPPQEGDST